MNFFRQGLTKFLTSVPKPVFTNVARCSNVTAVVDVEVAKPKTVPAEKLILKFEKDKLYKCIELELRCNDPAVVRSFAAFASTAASYFDVPAQSWALRKPQHDRLTLLKSVHIYKKHRVQYEYRTYFHFVKFSHLTGSTADTLLEYIQRNIPEGVSLKTTKIMLEAVPEHITPPQAEITPVKQ